MLNYRLLNNLGEVELKLVLALSTNSLPIRTNVPQIAHLINSSPDYVIIIINQLTEKGVISKVTRKGRNGFTELTLLTKLF